MCVHWNSPPNNDMFIPVIAILAQIDNLLYTILDKDGEPMERVNLLGYAMT